MDTKKFVRIMISPNGDGGGRNVARKTWMELQTKKWRTFRDMAWAIIEKFKLTYDIFLLSADEYLLDLEMDFSILDDMQFCPEPILVRPARDDITERYIITASRSSLALVTPTKQHTDSGISNDVEVDSGISDFEENTGEIGKPIEVTEALTPAVMIPVQLDRYRGVKVVGTKSMKRRTSNKTAEIKDDRLVPSNPGNEGPYVSKAGRFTNASIDGSLMGVLRRKKRVKMDSTVSDLVPPVLKIVTMVLVILLFYVNGVE